MIRRLYALLGRLAYWLSAPLLYLISLRAHARVRVIIIDHQGRILLVRNWYGRQRWALPGGGVKRHEPPVRAAQRELCEELSLDISQALFAPVGRIERYDTALPFAITLFSTELPSNNVVHPHPLELIDIRWVKPTKLPEPLHPSVRQALKLWHP